MKISWDFGEPFSNNTNSHEFIFGKVIFQWEIEILYSVIIEKRKIPSTLENVQNGKITCVLEKHSQKVYQINLGKNIFKGKSHIFSKTIFKWKFNDFLKNCLVLMVISLMKTIFLTINNVIY